MQNSSGDLSAGDGGWQADESLWSCDSTKDVVESRLSDPWYTESHSPTINADRSLGELSDDDFSRLSTEQCISLIDNTASPDSKKLTKAVTKSTPGPKTVAELTPLPLVEPLSSCNFSDPNQLMSSSKFEVDHTYLSKLEKKLERLYKLTGKAEKTSMIKQVSDRASVLFMSDAERQDTSTDTPLAANPVSKLLYPHQQALTAEEKIALIKSDHLTRQCEDVISDNSQEDNTSDGATCGVSDSASGPSSLTSTTDEGGGQLSVS